MTKTKIAIVGASGYSGQELVRLLLRHPHVAITAFTSRQNAGQAVGDVFPQFRGQVDAQFIEPKVESINADAVFLALPHGVAAEFAVPLLRHGMRVIDLSADFRLKSADVYKEFYQHDHPAPELLTTVVYGLPELHRAEIRQAQLVASPGCYPTSIILGIAPALKHGLARPQGIIVNSLSGVTGAGRKAAEEYLFAECNENARAYGLPKHRHLGEIEQELSAVAGAPVLISFAPHLIPINRGMVSTIHLEATGSSSDVLGVYRNFYRDEKFVRVTDSLPETKNVVLTNFCDLSVRFDARTKRLVVVSVIDNLTKGAAGQAVQSFNLMYGYEETAGLL